MAGALFRPHALPPPDPLFGPLLAPSQLEILAHRPVACMPPAAHGRPASRPPRPHATCTSSDCTAAPPACRLVIHADTTGVSGSRSLFEAGFAASEEVWPQKPRCICVFGPETFKMANKGAIYKVSLGNIGGRA